VQFAHVQQAVHAWLADLRALLETGLPAIMLPTPLAELVVAYIA
jgi:hypothetical protein